MDRGIKDEAFIRYALVSATSDDGRWVANQSCFNGAPDVELLPAIRAALVTSVNIYSAQNKLDECYLAEVLEVRTCGEARNFIDKVTPMINKKS